MAQRPDRRSSWPRKANVGCMWGLISMFNFRRGINSQRFLPSKIRRNGRYAGSWYSRRKVKLLTDFESGRENLNDTAQSEAGKILLSTSVKKLIAEDMFQVKQSQEISNAQNMQITYETSGNDLQTHETFDVVCNMHNESKTPSCYEPSSSFMELVEKISNNLNLAALLEELKVSKKKDQEMHIDPEIRSYSYLSYRKTESETDNPVDQPDRESLLDQTTLQKTLDEVLKALLCNDSSDAKWTESEKAFYQSEEFRHSLEILSSNKELFLKVLQNSNSYLVKYFQNPHNGLDGKIHEESCECPAQNVMLENEIGSCKQLEDHYVNQLFNKQHANKILLKDNSFPGKPLQGSDSSQVHNRIVILKPHLPRTQNSSNSISPSSPPHPTYNLRPDEKSARVASHFSIRDLKRRWRHFIGDSKKDQKMIAMDGVMHKIPYGVSVSGEISKSPLPNIEAEDLVNSCSNGLTSRPSKDVKITGTKSGPAEYKSIAEFEIEAIDNDNYKGHNAKTVHHTSNKEAYFQREAKMHLVDLLDYRDDGGISAKKASRSLGKLLAFPGYDFSPRYSPGKDKEPVSSPRQLNFSPAWSPNHGSDLKISGSSRFNMESSVSTANNSNDGIQVLDSSSELLGTHLNDALIKVSSPKGFFEKDGSKGTEFTEENSDHTDVIPKSESCGTADAAVENGYNGSSPYPRLDTPEEKPQSSISVATAPGSLLIFNVEAPESITDKPERPSPVSVLEPFFTEKIISTGKYITTDYAEYPKLLRKFSLEDLDDPGSHLVTLNSDFYEKNCVNDEKFKLEYLRALLEASGLCSFPASEKLCYSHQLLDFSLYDEVETPSGEIPDDLKLFFDSVNEVLEEIHKKSSSANPCVSFLKPGVRPFPSGENLVQEAWRGLNSFFVPKFPEPLEKVVKNDLECEDWMDIRFGGEEIGIEIGNAILDILLEETILEL